MTATTITICDTCKRDGWDAASGGTDGEALAALIEAAAAGAEGVATRRHSCLMGCAGACNVTLQAPGKMAYTLGRFDPTEEAAAGIVAYAALHARAETGVVPFREWPQPIKGHFVTRHPPLGE
jgi:predicted metal-binding protein